MQFKFANPSIFAIPKTSPLFCVELIPELTGVEFTDRFENLLNPAVWFKFCTKESQEFICTFVLSAYEKYW